MFFRNVSFGKGFGSFEIRRGQCFLKHRNRPQTFQIRPDAVIIVVDIVAIPVDLAVVVDVHCIVFMIARRAQPPSTLSLISILVAS